MKVNISIPKTDFLPEDITSIDVKYETGVEYGFADSSFKGTLTSWGTHTPGEVLKIVARTTKTDGETIYNVFEHAQIMQPKQVLISGAIEWEFSATSMKTHVIPSV